MVIADRVSTFTPAALPVQPTRVTSYPDETKQAKPKGCRRCGTRMYKGYDEFKCVMCGYADYQSHPTGYEHRTTNIVSSATRFVVRYIGDSHVLDQTLTHARLVRLNNRAVYEVRCPFCKQEMERSSLSGKRSNVREERFKCEIGHRVSLIPGQNGSLGWK
jgi:ribosomal protein L37E